MNYYQFNIGDYSSHTTHLEPLEDLAFRRLLDFLYLHEKPLPNDLDEIAKLIRMRTHCDSITYVLKEFFTLTDDGYINNRATSEILTFQEKSAKASASAKSRWDKNKNKNKQLPSKKKGDANALRTDCEGNAIQETRNNKQDTLNKKQSIDIPEKINIESWNEWIKYRSSKKKPVSQLAATKQFKLLVNYSLEEQADIIDKSISNDWSGLFALKTQKADESIPYDLVVKAYNENYAESVGIPLISGLTDRRKQAISKMWIFKPLTSSPTLNNFEAWSGYFNFCSKKDGLTGNSGLDWVANFDDLIDFNKYIKTIEGGYK